MKEHKCLEVFCRHLMIKDSVSGKWKYKFPIKHGNIDPKVKMRCWVNVINNNPEIELDRWNEILI